MFLLMFHSVTGTLLLLAFYFFIFLNCWPSRTHQDQEWNKLPKKLVLEGKAVQRGETGWCWSTSGVFSKGPRALPAEWEKTEFQCLERAWAGSAAELSSSGSSGVSRHTHGSSCYLTAVTSCAFLTSFLLSEKKPRFNIQSKAVLSYKRVCDQIMLCLCAAASH